MGEIIKTSMGSGMSTAPKKNIEVSTEQEKNTEENVNIENNVNKEKQVDNGKVENE